MTNLSNQQSNPFSTGGGGSNFETRVQAAFTTLLLTGQVAPCLPALPIAKIKLQGLYAGFSTDDFIVFTIDRQSGKVAKLLAQIKHEVSITEGNDTFAKVIQAAWSDFNNETLFNAEVDAFALITGPLSGTDINDVRPILEWARHAENELEFQTKINLSNFSSAAKIKKLEAFKTQITKANSGVEPTEKQLWEFLKCFYLIGYDLDSDTGSTLSLIHSLIAHYSTNDHLSIWPKIVDAVQLANQAAGTITLDTLPEDLRSSFDTRQNNYWASDQQKLKDHGKYIIDGINKTVGGFHVKRQKAFAELQEASEIHKFIFVSGKRGCGKSSIIREFTESKKHNSPIFCFRAEDFNKSHLDEVFTSMGLRASISEIESGLALLPRKYLLIESIEKLLELEYSAAFIDLLNFINKHSDWTIIATGRDYAFQQIVFNYLQLASIQHHSLIISDFDDYELDSLFDRVEPLKILNNNQSIRALIKIPFFADLAYRVITSGAKFASNDGERELLFAVWRDVIAKEQIRTNGMPLKRKKTFIDIAVKRAKRMSYGIPEDSFEPEVLLSLEADNLIRRDLTNGLVSLSHDVFEDIALEKYIERAQQEAGDSVELFLNNVGHEPAMNRAFRLWLHQKIRYGEDIKAFALSIINNSSIQQRWKDETTAAILLGNNPYDFLEQLQNEFNTNDFDLLKRFCFILRLACTVPYNSSSEQTDGLFFKPYGYGWGAIIRFLFEHKHIITNPLIPHVTSVLTDWTSLVYINNGLPADTARQAGLIALHMLDIIKKTNEEENCNKILNVIIRTIPAIQDEFNNLVDEIVQSNPEVYRAKYITQFCDIVLKSGEQTICKYVPDALKRIALHEWILPEYSDGKPKWFGSNIEYYFGFQHDDFCPASGAKGPFWYLLRYNPIKGIDFILFFINHASEKYASSSLDAPGAARFKPTVKTNECISAKQITIHLDDGSDIKQYCSSRLWGAYRGFSVFPYVLQSALMALENWLISAAEILDKEILEGYFNYILKHSNSVATTAILVSLATAFPNKLCRVILPVLKVPEFYDLDLARRTQEQGSNELNWFRTERGPLAPLYREERRTAALRSWRELDLEWLILNLQFTNLKNEILAIIDSLQAQVGTNEDWRFRFHRIDSRKLNVVKDEANKRFILEPQELASDLKEIQQATHEEILLNNRFTKLLLWANQIFDRKPFEGESYRSWSEALKEAQELLQNIINGSAKITDLLFSGIVKTAAICLRDHSADISEDDLLWCIEVIFSSIKDSFNTDGMTIYSDKTHYDASIAALVIPVLFDFADDDASKNIIKQLLIRALTHPNLDVSNAAANGIREHLWQRDPILAQACFFATISYAKLEIDINNELKEIYQQGQFEDSDQYEKEIKVSRIKLQELKENFRTQFSTTTKILSIEEIEQIGLDSHSSWHMAAPLLIIPDDSTEKSHIAFLSRILELLFKEEESKGIYHFNDRNKVEISPDLELIFVSRFSTYLYNLVKSDKADLFVKKLEEGCDRKPNLIDLILINIRIISEKDKNIALYWQTWALLSDKVQNIALGMIPSTSEWNRLTEKVRLIHSMLMFITSNHDIDYDIQDVSLGKDYILNFVKIAGKNPEVSQAMASLIYRFPELFFDTGIQILAKHQMETKANQLFAGINSAFYLERAIQKYLQIDNPGIIPRHIYQSLLVLLDGLVETASTTAYHLRENLIRSRRFI